MPYARTSTTGISDEALSDAQLLHAAHHLVEVYLVYLRGHETAADVFDTYELPASKLSLINAFRLVIATENRPGARTLLIKAGMTLAQFQDDIGSRMSLKPAEATKHGARNHDGFRRPDAGQLRKFDRALTLLGRERTHLTHVFQQAAMIAENKPVHQA